SPYPLIRLILLFPLNPPHNCCTLSQQMTKKVFITGIAGFLGSHIADRCLELGYEVVGCGNLIGGYLHNVPDGAEFFQYDCKYLNSMKKIMQGVDTVYHCAAT